MLYSYSRLLYSQESKIYITEMNTSTILLSKNYVTKNIHLIPILQGLIVE